MSKSKVIESKLKISRSEDRFSKYDEVDGLIMRKKPKINSFQRGKNKVEIEKFRIKIKDISFD